MEVAGAAGTTGPEVLWSALVGQRSHWARCPPPVTVAVTIPRGNPWAFKDSEGEGLAGPAHQGLAFPGVCSMGGHSLHTG